MISISVEAQDPLICATLTDTVQNRLQQFITDYRTSKARKDLEYYQELCSEAKSKYEKVRQTYGSYADANNDIILESYKLKENDLEMKCSYSIIIILHYKLKFSKLVQN